MFSSSFDFNKNSSIGNENSNVPSDNDSDASLEELKSQLAIRFLIKRTKRFNLVAQQLREKQLLKQQRQLQMQQRQQQMQQRQQQLQGAVVKRETLPDCLLYLGLAPKNRKMYDRKNSKEDQSDCQFLKPRIYECSYCIKIFFHKLVCRRHMMRHMRKIHWCLKCNRGFTSKIFLRRHELGCRG